MDDAPLVCRFERFSDLNRQSKRFLDGYRPFLEPVGERGAVDKLLDQEAVSVRFFQAVDRCDVGMIQRREDLGFPLESGQPFRGPR